MPCGMEATIPMFQSPVFTLNSSILCTQAPRPYPAWQPLHTFPLQTPSLWILTGGVALRVRTRRLSLSACLISAHPLHTPDTPCPSRSVLLHEHIAVAHFLPAPILSVCHFVVPGVTTVALLCTPAKQCGHPALQFCHMQIGAAVLCPGQAGDSYT